MNDKIILMFTISVAQKKDKDKCRDMGADKVFLKFDIACQVPGFSL